MLSSLIVEGALRQEQAAIVTGECSTSWSELQESTQHFLSSLASLRRRRVGLSFQPVAESYAALAAMDTLECDVVLMDSRTPTQETLRLAQSLKLGAVLLAAESAASPKVEVHNLENEGQWSGSGTVTILTSGSTGEPKAARHSWGSLCRPVRKRSESSAPRWLLTYRPQLYAGLQVALQCFADCGTLAIPGADWAPQSIARFMQDAGVQFVSATPSYWRRLLMFADGDVLKRVPLAQITLGGEVVDQPILNKLKQYFPGARLVHIYATTELGRCFSVNDGLAGFPIGYLQTMSIDKVELAVSEGELLVRSPNSMKMYDPYSAQNGFGADWYATGDLVETQADRVYFVGRKTDMINVAGSKVHPVEVERVIRAIPGVSDVRVFGKSSSIAGELVACEIVPEPHQDRDVLRATVDRTCRSSLASYQQPRLIKLVDEIALSPANKTVRSRPS